MGVQIQPQHAAYTDIRRACAEAEAIGVDIAFTWDWLISDVDAP